uniref:Chitin-binding type-2 domain-containing protein n=1 Tax=Mycena chlorophos TaxID=658473 RepID=A0ABQ0LVN5_MYCCL|nr:predicted protein [Mycena chlorophos]
MRAFLSFLALISGLTVVLRVTALSEQGCSAEGDFRGVVHENYFHKYRECCGEHFEVQCGGDDFDLEKFKHIEVADAHCVRVCLTMGSAV